jgi:hypothetical protein
MLEKRDPTNHHKPSAQDNRRQDPEVLQKLKTSATSASSGLDTHMTHIQVDPNCLNFGGWDFAILGCSTHSMTMHDRSGVEPPIPA